MKRFYGVLSVIIGVILVSGLVSACSSSAGSVAPVSGPFKFENLTLNPAEVYAGVPSLITIKVTNTGAADAPYTGKVKISAKTNNSVPTYLTSESVTVAAGSTRIISVATSIKNPGTYQVTWGSLSKTLLVSAEGTNQAGNVANGQPIAAPDFKAVDVVTGKTITLSQFKGKSILLNFVNYGCNPSLNNVVSAQLVAIKRVYEQNPNFEPVSVFCGCCPPEVLKQFAKDNGLNWSWILDTDNSIVTKYQSYLRQYGYPTLIFIDNNMFISEVTGAVNQSALAEKLSNLSGVPGQLQ